MKRGYDQYPWTYGLPIAAYYAALGVFQGYMVKYYQWKGIAADSTQMMWLMAATPLVAMATQPLWGAVGDRLRYRNSALLVMCLAALAVLAFLPLYGGFPWLLLFTGLYALFFPPIQPMGDSIILESLQEKRAAFGPVRLMGSVGYGLTNLLLAGFFEGRYHLVPWTTAVFALLLMASLPVLPKTRGYQRGRAKVPMRRVLKAPHMKALMLMTVGLQLAMGYYYSYFTLHFTSLPGGSTGLLGLGFFISAMSELPFLLLSDRLYRRWGAGRLLVVSALFLLVRFTVMGLSRSAQPLLFSQLLHGGGFIVITVSVSRYISQSVPDELKASGQMLLSVAGYGLARVFGTFLGGSISRLTGGTAGGFLAMAGLCLLCLLLGARHFFRLPVLNGLPAGQQCGPS